MISYFIKRTAFYAVLTLIITPFQGKAQTPVIDWEKTYGGSDQELGFSYLADGHCPSVLQTADGGYIMATNTLSNDGDITVNNGGKDIWVVKTNATGAIQWQKSYGGSGDDYVSAMDKTSDGGYIITGKANGYNALALKINATGSVQWQKTYTNAAMAYDIRQTTDGGYIIAGDSRLNSQNNGDYWIAKLDASGSLIWEKIYGGKYLDAPNTVRQTTDGGYIVAGLSDGDVPGYKGGLTDIWILKLDVSGELEWQKTYGGSNEDIAYDIQQTTDGGYIVTGTSNSNDDDLTDNKGNRDLWVLKLNNSGGKQWQKNLGGKLRELGGYVQQTNDGGYIIVCGTSSVNGDVNSADRKGGIYDIWAIKLSSTGAIQWNKILGGPGYDLPYSVQQTSDNGYIIAALVGANGGDITGYKGGVADVWIVKLKGNLAGVNDLHDSNNEFTIYPNPANDYIEIVSEDGALISNVTVMNIDGRILNQTDVNGQSAKINISNLTAGNYLIEVKNGDGVSMIKRFVKP